VAPFFRDMDFKEVAKDKIPWDGTISVNDFFLSASTFSDKWKMFNPSFPPWLWTAIPKHHLGTHKVTPLSYGYQIHCLVPCLASVLNIFICMFPMSG